MSTFTGNVRRRPAAVLLTALLAVATTITSACSSSSGTSADGTVTIRLGAYAASGSDFEKKLTEQVAQFEQANPKVKIKLEVAPYAEFFKRLGTQVAGGNAPDAWLSDGVFVPQYAARGALADLSDRVDADTAAKTLGIDLIRDPDGKLYGFPQGAQTPALYYNKKLFDAAGVKYPTADWTYQDLAVAA
jgi:multiple sugar transport system substrate-binding protein